MKIQCDVATDCRGLKPSTIIKKILKARGIKDIKHFLNPTEDDVLPLNMLPNIDNAVQTVVNALQNYHKIGVLWDVDADGVTAGAIMTRYLFHFGDNITPYINNGKVHGLKGQDLSQLKSQDLLIIVDSLDNDCTYYKELAANNVEIIILDHHLIEDESYEQYATLVSSQGTGYPNRELSGAGVVWKFCKALDTVFETEYANELVDLAACGIIADMCDVSENSMENRAIVKLGFDTLRNPFLKRVLKGRQYNAQAVSFSIAPLINAANRTHNNDLLIGALLEDDTQIVVDYIKTLEQCKRIQNDEMSRILPDLISQAETQKDGQLLVLYARPSSDINGLMANKIMSIYQKPTFVLSKIEEDNGIRYAGSARAVGVDNLCEICNRTGLAFAGGHPSAFGVSVDDKNIDEFVSQLSAELQNIEFTDHVLIDADLNASDITLRLINKMQKVNEITGTGFPALKIRVKSLRYYSTCSMSQGKHLKICPDNHDWVGIKWNWNGDFEEMDDNALLNTPLALIGTLDAQYIGRIYTQELICDYILTKEERL